MMFLCSMASEAELSNYDSCQSVGVSSRNGGV